MSAPASRRTVLVTGASAGIGEAFAHVFAANGFDVVLTARREERLRAVAAALEQRHGAGARIIAADLADPAAPARITGELSAAGVNVDALVNNAGYGVPGAYRKTKWEDQRDFLQVLVTAGAELTHRLLPGMVERRYGRIINVASLAGLLPAVPGHTLYAASKAFAVSFSQALALEVQPFGVHVTAVCPGFTRSEFHDVSGTRDQVDQLPGFMWMDADTVARQGYDAVMAGEIVYVNGLTNNAIALLGRLLPQRLLLMFMTSQAGKYRKA